MWTTPVTVPEEVEIWVEADHEPEATVWPSREVSSRI
jgi:hypothetical protein